VPLGLGVVDERVVGLTRGRHRGDEKVEVEAADQLEALDVVVAVADAVEQNRTPVALADHDRVAGEEAAMLARVPEVGGCAACVSGGRDDLEVVVEAMALRECVVDIAGISETADASSAWQWSGAPNVAATQSQVGAASWR
jgi:hypothetical protein